ncbi:MAG: hypothetical protein WCI05_09570 [Myxococcales bacterium]
MRVGLPMALVLVCCGSTSCGSSPARPAPSSPNDGLAAYAASQGGLASLGGGATPAPSSRPDRLSLSWVDAPPKLDGVLSEWPAGVELTQRVQGDATFGASLALLYDDERLWIGGELRKDPLVRTAQYGDDEDRVSLVLAFPKADGTGVVAYDIGLYPGKPGEVGGAVKVNGRRDAAGAKLVEAPVDGGVTFEAVVPWAVFPEAKVLRVGLRGVARAYGARTVLASGPGDMSNPASLAPMPCEPELAMIEQLLTPRRLSFDAPRFEVIADVNGDGVRERVAVFGSFLTVVGSGYLKGRTFFYRDLGGEVLRVEARDITSDGKHELIVTRRRTQGNVVREDLEVYGAQGDSELDRIFAHEVSIRSGSRKVSNAIELSPGSIEVSVEPAVGWDAASFREPVATDVEPVLVSWGAVSQQVYRFDGARFAKRP